MSRAVLLVLCGAWLGALFLSWAVASATFRTAETVAALPPGSAAGDHAARVPAEARRPLFRHLASEVNRRMFGALGWAQLVVAAAVALLAWPVGGAARWTAAVAVLIVAAQGLGLGPAILELGRSVDFVARPLPPDVGRRFGMLHGAYVILDLVKALLVLALAAAVARRG